MRDEHLEWRDLLAQSGDAIWVLDEDDRIIAWNNTAEEMFGYRREEIIGESLRKLIPGDLIDAREPERIRKALNELGGVRDYETRRVTKDGRVLEVSLTRTLYASDEAAPVSATIVRDLTLRRALERQIVEAEKLAAVGELAASVAQEIGAPLTTIGLLVDHLRRGPCEQHSKQLETIEQELARIGFLTRGLVELAKPSELKLGEIQIEDVLGGVIDLMGPGLRRSGVTVDLKIVGQLPIIRGDAGQLQQMVLHLAMNSQRALADADQEGNLCIEAKVGRGFPVEGRPLRKAITIEVRDDGPGIDPADLPYVFTPFFSRSGGSGLGLPMARQVAHAHGGTLDVESMPGESTTVRIHLPVETDE